MRTQLRLHALPLRAAIGFAWLSLVPVAQTAAAETLSATAQVKTAGGTSASAPLTIVIERFATDAERDALLAAVKKGGTAAARALLLPRTPVGTVKVGSSSTEIKYAYARSTGGGRLITVVTGSPIAFIGASLPGAPAKTGYDLGLVLLETAATGPGHGELSAAAKITVNEQGAVVTQDYSGEVVKLTNVVS